MLSRFISKPSNLKFFALISPRYSKPISQNLSNSNPNLKFYSASNNGDDPSSSFPHLWEFSAESNQANDSIFEKDPQNLDKLQETHKTERPSSWSDESLTDGFVGDSSVDEWATAEGFKAWNFEVEEREEKEKLFDVNLDGEENVELGLQGLIGSEKRENIEEQKKLEVEENALTSVLKGPNRAFGDLVAASGITDEMLDSLIILKDLEGIRGLPPLHEIEDKRYENNTRKSSRAEIERQKQEEVAKARVRQVDEKGRAYGTGRRKCSIARVWIQPGDGTFVVNDKEFDIYFPQLDHRASLLRPFSETKTLGKWDVNSTVKGGGVSGQVGALQLGISRALQNWAPDLRPPLREGGFLTRDSRVVERKKPGKAKARKSFQWVKR